MSQKHPKQMLDAQQREDEFRRIFYAIRTNNPKLSPKTWRKKALKLMNKSLGIWILISVATVSLLAAVVFSEPSYFAVTCPKCDTKFTREPVTMSIVETNVLGGKLQKKSLTMKCPNATCGNVFEAYTEKLIPDVTAMEVKVPRRFVGQDVPPPLPIPTVLQTRVADNTMVLTAASGHMLIVVPLHPDNAAEVFDKFATNKAAAYYLIMVERKQ